MKNVLTQINVYPMWRKTKGKGIKVGFIDTGVVIGHPDLNIIEAKDFTPANNPEDEKGHGTSVAGIIGAKDNDILISGVAPECSLYSAKIFSDKGNVEFADALNWLVDICRVDIVNMSIGTTNYYENDLAIKNAIEKGVILVAAVGQESLKDNICYPARHPDVIAVTYVDRNMVIAPKANRGGVIDVAAPGVLIETLSKFSNYTIYQDGSSFAAPVITGVIALFIADFKNQNGRKPTLKEVRQYLYSNCIDLGVKGADGVYGYGFFRFPTPVGERKIELTIGSKVAYVDGERYELDVPAKIENGRTLVPIRFVAEKMNCSVEYIAELNMVEIKMNNSCI